MPKTQKVFNYPKTVTCLSSEKWQIKDSISSLQHTSTGNKMSEKCMSMAIVPSSQENHKKVSKTLEMHYSKLQNVWTI